MFKAKLIPAVFFLLVFVITSGCDTYAPPWERKEIKALIEELGDKDYQGFFPGYGSEVTKRRLESYGRRAIPLLIERLGDENQYIRDGVREILSFYRYELTGKLIKLLDDESPSVRYDALGLLTPIQNDRMDVAAAIAKLLHDEEQDIRFTAALNLGYYCAYYGGQVEGLTSVLIEVANTGDKEERTNAISYLGKMGTYPIEAAPGFILGITGDTATHNMSTKALKEIGYDKIIGYVKSLNPETITTDYDLPVDPGLLLGALLSADELELRLAAAYKLSQLGTTGGKAVPALAETLFDKEPGLRWNAVNALGEIVPQAVLAIPALRKVAMEDTHKEIRIAAQNALANLKPRMADAVPYLIETLDSDNYEIYGAAVEIIGEIGPGAKDAVPVLSKLLLDEIYVREFAVNDEVKKGPGLKLENPLTKPVAETILRNDIAHALAAIGPDAKAAVPALSILLLDLDYTTVESGIIALKAIGGDPVPHIIDYLNNADPHLTHLVIISSANIGRWNQDAFPVFAESLKGHEFGLRLGARAVRDGTYPDLSYAMAVYKRLLEEDDPSVRQFAVFLTGVHNPKPDEAFRIVLDMLSDEDRFVRATAAVTLGYMGLGAGDVKPYLVELLDNEDEIISCAAVSALALMGKDASDVLPKLRELYVTTGEEKFPQLHSYLKRAILWIETGRVGRNDRRYEITDDGFLKPRS